MHQSFKLAESLLEKFTHNASIVINQCTSVVIVKVTIKNNAGVTALAVISMIGISTVLYNDNDKNPLHLSIYSLHSCIYHTKCSYNALDS